MRFTNILVASDLSEQSDKALRRAAQIAARTSARLHVLYVIDDALPAKIADDIRSSATQLLEERLRAMQPDFDAGKLRIEARTGRAWKTILATADDIKADLVVMGTHRSRGFAELFQGTTIERVAKASRASMLMVNTEAESDYSDVLVGVDFSPAAHRASAAAHDLAPNAEITFASVYHVLFKSFIDRAEPGDSDIREEKGRIERELFERMTEFKATLPADAAKAGVAFLEGGPASRLCVHAEATGADLIAVGSHGRPWLAEILLGSTAKELLYNAPCDVLIAK